MAVEEDTAVGEAGTEAAVVGSSTVEAAGGSSSSF